MNPRPSRRIRLILPALGLLLVFGFGCGPDSDPVSPAGTWRAWLDSPGGELPFGLVVHYGPGGRADWKAAILNGPEELEIGEVSFQDGTLVLGLTPYDAEIRAVLSKDGKRLDGRWSKTAGPEKKSELPFHATLGRAPRFTLAGASDASSPADAARVRGRWAVDFSSDDLAAVAVIEPGLGNTIHGTFLTATGDYRYLAGSFSDGRLRLSTFDGAHAFLFHAVLQEDGSLAGDFWSRESWHETWTARKDPDAQLPDPFHQTVWTAGHDFGDAAYPDLDGQITRLDDPKFGGKARLLVIFGSWCPNCNDATDLLVELDRRYRDRGLSILGLAFELTGDPEEDAAQVRRYSEYHGLEYPVLLAGTSDKDAASAAFPLVDRVRSFPTLVFMTGNGEVKAVYSGFSGPATGPAYDRLRKDFVDWIENLLS